MNNYPTDLPIDQTVTMPSHLSETISVLSLRQLNQDLIIYILNFLSLMDLLNMQTMSKSYKQLIRTYSRWDITIKPKNVDLTRFLLINFNFTRYDLNMLPRLPQDLLFNLIKCRHIIIPVAIRSEITDYHLQYFTNCLSLNILDANISDDSLKQLSICENLVLGTFAHDSDHGFPILRCPISDKGLQHLTNCVRLHLYNCVNVTGYGFEYMSKCLYIKLSGCYRVSGESLQYLSHCHTVVVDGCHNNDSTIKAGLPYLKNCHTVCLSGLNLVDQDLSHLSQCHSVSVSWCKRITDQGLQYLNHCIRLDLRGCCSITDQGLSYLTNCQYINLIGCPNITAKGLSYLTKCRRISLDGVITRNHDNIPLETIRQLMDKGIIVDSRGPSFYYGF